MENYRLSSYTIFVELEDSDDKYMLVHGYTGAIDIASGNIVRYLKSHSTLLKIEDCPFSQSIFNSLVKRGYITQKVFEEEVDYLKKLAELFHRKDKILNKSFLFAVTYDCNFRCSYCYESSISKQGSCWTRKTFTKEMVDKAYAAMLEIEPQRKLHINTIILYGGEPLLAENKKIVEYIVRKGHDLGYKFSAITNGYDLDHFKDLLSRDLISSLQITIDGSKEEHDKRRVHYQAKGTFDKIIDNVKNILEFGVTVVIRVNTDSDNFEKLHELQRLFNELGFTNKKNFSFYSALLLDREEVSSDVISHFKYVGRKEYNHRHKEENFKFNCQDYGLFENIYRSIVDKKLMNFRSIRCAAQCGEYIFDPYGNIYPCWSVIGKQQHMLGSYVQDSIVWTEALNLWHNRNIGRIVRCSHCKFALLCHGGCASTVLDNETKSQFNCFEDFSDTFEIAANRAYKKIISHVG